MPSLTVALLLLEWLHDGVYAGRCVLARAPTSTDLSLTLNYTSLGPVLLTRRVHASRSKVTVNDSVGRLC
jgi:hypothetical protein